MTNWNWHSVIQKYEVEVTKKSYGNVENQTITNFQEINYIWVNLIVKNFTKLTSANRNGYGTFLYTKSIVHSAHDPPEDLKWAQVVLSFIEWDYCLWNRILLYADEQLEISEMYLVALSKFPKKLWIILYFGSRLLYRYLVIPNRWKENLKLSSNPTSLCWYQPSSFNKETQQEVT